MNWDPRNIPEERLSSIDKYGKRVFLYPAKVKGHYKKLRNYVYYFLLVLFLVIPWTSFQGEQTLLLDLSDRRFVFFGAVFSPQDGPLIFFPLNYVESIEIDNFDDLEFARILQDKL